MLIATMLIATSFPVVAAIADGLDALVLTFLRFLIAAVLFLPIVILKYGLTLPGLRDLARYAAISACMVGFFWCMFEALRTTTALNTGALFTFIPSIAALVSAVLLKDRLDRKKLIALVLGSVGALWVVFRGDPSRLLGLELNHGDLIFFLGCIFFGFYTPLVKFFHKGEAMPVMTFWTLATGALWLFLLSIPRLIEIDWPAIEPKVYLGTAYLAIFTTLITFFLTQYSTVRLGPTRVMAYSYMNPALVLALTWALGQTPPSLMILPGVFIVLGATVVLQGWLRLGGRSST
ncbi:DMT family transporter [Pelagibius sp. Alg239-R121]|uniref:DMT family transporter n=1 Tax=Pelagibius sp. Alg239-R121 TaxID=2993448 RepID=UPI0024A6FD26|nr:DMT family transporter [Pelagibius sp. Alg239-R121]